MVISLNFLKRAWFAVARKPGRTIVLLIIFFAVANLVLAGISTSGVVLSTVRAAADLDFGLTVLADACTDGDPEVHRVLTEKVFPRQADVVTAEEWIATLNVD